jgi:hypothetical protein
MPTERIGAQQTVSGQSLELLKGIPSEQFTPLHRTEELEGGGYGIVRAYSVRGYQTLLDTQRGRFIVSLEEWKPITVPTSETLGAIHYEMQSTNPFRIGIQKEGEETRAIIRIPDDEWVKLKFLYKRLDEECGERVKDLAELEKEALLSDYREAISDISTLTDLVDTE